ncbi:uncharacterized protein LOC104432822 [Eucalyptus grandis]|uniref:uncharacterized protein LOC104432822 n=1 Tax=Eucalyptus grandis TaxID=71139 RepID=UPI00192EE7C1|nr:uncharacterized protein LOC104432822 [Eucalyptus grandis]
MDCQQENLPQMLDSGDQQIGQDAEICQPVDLQALRSSVGTNQVQRLGRVPFLDLILTFREEPRGCKGLCSNTYWIRPSKVLAFFLFKIFCLRFMMSEPASKLNKGEDQRTKGVKRHYKTSAISFPSTSLVKRESLRCAAAKMVC